MGRKPREIAANSLSGKRRAAQLAGLRRLVDLTAAARHAAPGGAAAVTLGDLQAGYRRHHGLGDDVPVSMAQLREWVDWVGQLEQALPRRTAVTWEHLAVPGAAPAPPSAPPGAPP